MIGGGRSTAGAREQLRSLIDQREQTHGAFDDVATVAQTIKAVLRVQPNWARMPRRMQESLDMIATKIARIICGNAFEPDHWRDIAGYAQLILMQLEYDE